MMDFVAIVTGTVYRYPDWRATSPIIRWLRFLTI
jgi:hypothetical protein